MADADQSIWASFANRVNAATPDWLAAQPARVVAPPAAPVPAAPPASAEPSFWQRLAASPSESAVMNSPPARVAPFTPPAGWLPRPDLLYSSPAVQEAIRPAENVVHAVPGTQIVEPRQDFSLAEVAPRGAAQAQKQVATEQRRDAAADFIRTVAQMPRDQFHAMLARMAPPMSPILDRAAQLNSMTTSLLNQAVQTGGGLSKEGVLTGPNGQVHPNNNLYQAYRQYMALLQPLLPMNPVNAALSASMAPGWAAQ